MGHTDFHAYAAGGFRGDGWVEVAVGVGRDVDAGFAWQPVAWGEQGRADKLFVGAGFGLAMLDGRSGHHEAAPRRVVAQGGDVGLGGGQAEARHAADGASMEWRRFNGDRIMGDGCGELPALAGVGVQQVGDTGGFKGHCAELLQDGLCGVVAREGLQADVLVERCHLGRGGGALVAEVQGERARGRGGTIGLRWGRHALRVFAAGAKNSEQH